MGLFYKRDGTPYPNDDSILWAKDYKRLNYRIIKQDRLFNGYFISTVWLGINHNFGFGPPLIFETMVFDDRGNVDLDMKRYSTESEAIKGHSQMVRKWKKMVLPSIK